MSSCSVKVCARFRPNNAREENEEKSLKLDEFKINIQKPSSVGISFKRSFHEYTFDHVYDKTTRQIDVYEESARPCIVDVLEGYNGTIFAYGQTGSGKTWTMFGLKTDPANTGVIPRACREIFSTIEDISNDESSDLVEFSVKCSFLEIYRENLRDLLSSSKEKKGQLRIRESSQRGVFVDGIAEEFATCEDDIIDMLETGEMMRTTKSTGMNQRSSRSHSVFMLQINQKSKDGSSKTGKLNLIDLAGSERIQKTGAQGETLEEAKTINQSLSCLGQCINSLVTGKAHIPFRESKLTRLLQESLGGNTKTTLYVTASSSMFNAEETISTMEFGKRAKTIKNKVKVNKQRSIEELEAHLNLLQQEYQIEKMYSTRLEKQIDYMRSGDYDREQGIPDEFLAVRPKRGTPAGKGSSNARSGGGGGTEWNISAADLLCEDGMALVETKLELQEYRNDLRIDLEQYQFELNTLKEDIDLLTLDVENLSNEMAGYDSELGEMVQSKEHFFQNLKNQETSLVKEKQSIEEEYKQLQENMNLLNEETNELQKRLTEADDNVLVLFTDNEKCREEHQALARAIQMQINLIQELEAERQTLSDRMRDSQEEVTGIRLDNKDIVEETKKIVTELAEFKENLDSNRELLSDRQKTITSLETEKKKLEAKKNDLQQQLKDYRIAKTQEHTAHKQAIRASTRKITHYQEELETSFEHEMQLIQHAENGFDVSDLQSRLAGAKNERLALEAAHIKTLEEFTIQEESNSAIEKQIVALRNQLEESQKKYLSHQLKKSKLEADNAKNKLRKRHVEKTIYLQNLKSTRSTNQMETLSNKLERLQKEISTLNNELNKIDEKEFSNLKLKNEWKEKVDKLIEECTISEKKTTRLTVEKNREARRASEAIMEVRKQQSQMKDQKIKLSIYKEKLRDYHDSKIELETRVNEMAEELRLLKLEVDSKTEQRVDTQKSAVEFSRLTEQLERRRRFRNQRRFGDTGTGNNLMNAFEKKMDLDETRQSLRSSHVGTLILRDAMLEDQRSKTLRGDVPSIRKHKLADRRKSVLFRQQSFTAKILKAREQVFVMDGMKMTADDIQMVEDIFHAFDKDGNGSIDKEELKELLKSLGKHLNDEELDELMEELDEDGNGTLEFKEFLKGMDRLNEIYCM